MRRARQQKTMTNRPVSTSTNETAVNSADPPAAADRTIFTFMVPNSKESELKDEESKSIISSDGSSHKDCDDSSYKPANESQSGNDEISMPESEDEIDPNINRFELLYDESSRWSDDTEDGIDRNANRLLFLDDELSSSSEDSIKDGIDRNTNPFEFLDEESSSSSEDDDSVPRLEPRQNDTSSDESSNTEDIRHNQFYSSFSVSHIEESSIEFDSDTEVISVATHTTGTSCVEICIQCSDGGREGVDESLLI